MSTAVTTKAGRIFARLVRGKSYFLRDKAFHAGKEVEVSADERRHLEQHALDRITYVGISDDGGNETRVLSKFDFRVE
jgi:hypothetical protein